MRREGLGFVSGTSLAYACAVSALSVVVSLLLLSALLIRGFVPNEEGILLYGLPWIASWIFSAIGIMVVYRWRAKWIRFEPRWLQVGLLPVLALAVGISATFAGGVVFWAALGVLHLVRSGQ